MLFQLFFPIIYFYFDSLQSIQEDINAQYLDISRYYQGSRTFNMFKNDSLNIFFKRHVQMSVKLLEYIYLDFIILMHIF